MNSTEQLLDLIDRWDETPSHVRDTPEAFCREYPELLSKFLDFLQQRGMFVSLLSGDKSLAVQPESMIESLQSERFRLVRFHDSGGLGWVYLANDQELDRTVAIKCLQPTPAIDPDARQRFIHEAEITARLEHPGIVPIYSLDKESDQLQPYYAMRFVEGQTLRAVIRQVHESKADIDWKGVAGTRLLRAFVSVCETVGYAHSRNVIHRDLKSANIMLGPFGETLVLDWGLAKRIDEPELHNIAQSNAFQCSRSDTTKTGVTIGTIAFMSPEQAQGEWTQVDTRSDIFSLGAILYQILTGEALYQGKTALRDAIDGRFSRPREIKPSIPKELEAICLKALHPSPNLRYSNTSDFKQDIEKFLSDEPISARPDSWLDSCQRFLRKYRKAVTVAFWMSLAIMGILAYFLALSSAKNRELYLANQREQEATETAIHERDRAYQSFTESIRSSYTAQMANLSSTLRDRQPIRLLEAIGRSRPLLGSPLDPRGHEWWIAWKQSLENHTIIPFQQGPVLGQCILDGGKKVGVWDFEQNFRIVESSTGKTLFVTPFRFRQGNIPCSADGSTLAIPTETSIDIYRFKGHEYSLLRTLSNAKVTTIQIEQIALSANGDRCVVLGAKEEVLVWGVESGEVKSIPIIGEVQAMKLSPNGRYLVLLSDQIQVLDLQTDQIFAIPAGEHGPILGFSFNSRADLLAWSKTHVTKFELSEQRGEKLWELQFQGDVNEENLFDQPIGIYEVVVDDSIGTNTMASWLIVARRPASLFASALRSTVYYRRPYTNTTDALSPRTDRITEIFHPSVSHIVDVDVRTGTMLLEVEGDTHLLLSLDDIAAEILDPTRRGSPVHQVAWNASGNLLVTTIPSSTDIDGNQGYAPGELSKIEFHDEATRSIHTMDLLDLPLVPSAFTGQAVLSSNGFISATTLGEHRLGIRCLIDKSATWTVNADEGDQIALWNRLNPNVLEENASAQKSPFDGSFESVIHGASQAPIPPCLDLPWVAITKEDFKQNETAVHSVIIVNYELGEVVKEIPMPGPGSPSTVISMDGRRFATACGKIVRTWTVNEDATISESATIELQSFPSCLSFSATNRFLAIGSVDGRVCRVQLDAEGGQHSILDQRIHDGLVIDAQFTADDQRILSVSDDRTLVVIDPTSMDELLRLPLSQRPTCMAIDSVSNAIAIGDRFGQVRLIRPGTPSKLLKLVDTWAGGQREEFAKEIFLREHWAQFVRNREIGESEINEAINLFDGFQARFAEWSFEELKAEWEKSKLLPAPGK